MRTWRVAVDCAPSAAAAVGARRTCFFTTTLPLPAYTFLRVVVPLLSSILRKMYSSTCLHHVMKRSCTSLRHNALYHSASVGRITSDATRSPVICSASCSGSIQSSGKARGCAMWCTSCSTDVQLRSDVCTSCFTRESASCSYCWGLLGDCDSAWHPCSVDGCTRYSFHCGACVEVAAPYKLPCRTCWNRAGGMCIECGKT